jgi:5-histidylcysteine sulfoxide synthase/putative 4-mercaptohistidine N1-methyltranferase
VTQAQIAPVGWRGNLTRHDDGQFGRRGSWWTGIAPNRGTCPGVGQDGVLHSFPLPDLSRCGTEGALAYFENGWTLTETLFSALQGLEPFYRPPRHGLRHPLVFYYSHPAALFVNKLRVAGLRNGPVNADYEQLFETGVDEMGWDDLSKNEMSWPRVREVTEYRRRVHDLIGEGIERDPDIARGAVLPGSPAWALFMGMEHERIHLETSSVLIRELPVGLLKRPEGWPMLHPSVRTPSVEVPREGRDFPAPQWASHPGGEAVIGKPAGVPTFGWDNGWGERRVRVRPFAAGRRLVSNGEFYQFVRSGEYGRERWWSKEGWKWRTFRNARWPAFWVPDGPAGLHRYQLRTLFEVVPMPWSWPVIANYHEAKAYAAWRAEMDGLGRPYRLLTEAEHHLLRDAEGDMADPAVLYAGGAMAAQAGRNAALAFGSESPVDAFAPAASGVHDLFGNVWQWCEDHFSALPGFRVHPLYEDFSTPCFDGEHNLIMGGSFVSTGDEAGKFARFHFRRHFHQHAGFRLVQSDPSEDRPETTCLDAPPPHVGAGPCCSRAPERDGAASRAGRYDTSGALDAWLLLHYGTVAETLAGLPAPAEAIGFTRNVARLAIDASARLGIPTGRALDVGCAVGGATFALARSFGEVTGVDLSASFVQAASVLARDGQLAYGRRDEGDLVTPLTACVDPDLDRSRTSFRRADACALPPDFEPFDLVLLANLLDRLPSPRTCLGRMSGPRGLVKRGGLLVVASPFTWLEELTPRDAWLGGTVRDGCAIRSEDGLRTVLEGEFSFIEAHDMPFLLREHARKFEYVVSRVTIWQRA